MAAPSRARLVRWPATQGARPGSANGSTRVARRVSVAFPAGSTNGHHFINRTGEPAAFLVIGLPELFREFASARMLVFGLVMVVMMVFRPQGLLPAGGGRFSPVTLARGRG